ncbi:hypothetical protein K505DRAFT_335747 [Melanomma pulvis-pyrius CBS 109.77]|uniref:Uncharacterized protein n=1 Tax=Melanomma pulvis-pyrius CBS 109.77 TaxID=1314802 RepID=A0A6A6XJN4_9PLEO|nr:hypothetical protein K505DRAFT_335747 [Melanomma pulvis-pyrius CBS 109.77]
MSEADRLTTNPPTKSSITNDDDDELTTNPPTKSSTTNDDDDDAILLSQWGARVYGVELLYMAYIADKWKNFWNIFHGISPIPPNGLIRPLFDATETPIETLRFYYLDEKHWQEDMYEKCFLELFSTCVDVLCKLKDCPLKDKKIIKAKILTTFKRLYFSVHLFEQLYILLGWLSAAFLWSAVVGKSQSQPKHASSLRPVTPLHLRHDSNSESLEGIDTHIGGISYSFSPSSTSVAIHSSNQTTMPYPTHLPTPKAFWTFGQAAPPINHQISTQRHSSAEPSSTSSQLPASVSMTPNPERVKSRRSKWPH